MKKMMFAAALSCAAAMFTCSCGSNNEQAAEKKAPEAKPAPAVAAPLRMITESGFPPYEFSEGDKIVGVDVEICQAIANRLGRGLETQDAKFDAVIPSVVAGKADFGAAGITVTEERKQNVAFSVPYVTSGIVIISKKGAEYKDAESVKGKRIGVQSGTTSDTFCVETLKQEPERFDNPPIAAAALTAGKIDLLIVDIDPAKNIIKGDDTLVISSDFLSKEEFAIAIKKDNTELLSVANEVIEELVESGKIDAWRAEYDKRYAELRGVEEAAEEAKEAVEEVKEAVAEAVEEVKEEVKEAAEEVKAEAVKAKEEAKEAAAEVKEAVAEKAAEVKEEAAAAKEEAKEAAEEVKAEAVEAKEEAKEAVAEVKEAVAEKAAEVKETVKEAAASVKDAAIIIPKQVPAPADK